MVAAMDFSKYTLTEPHTLKKTLETMGEKSRHSKYVELVFPCFFMYAI